MEKDYEVFEFEYLGYKTHIVADKEETAINFYENEVESNIGDHRRDSVECGYTFNVDYTTKKLTDEELDELQILEPCGGLWTNSASKVLAERMSKDVKLPFILCEEH